MQDGAVSRVARLCVRMPLRISASLSVISTGSSVFLTHFSSTMTSVDNCSSVSIKSITEVRVGLDKGYRSLRRVARAYFLQSCAHLRFFSKDVGSNIAGRKIEQTLRIFSSGRL